VKATRTAQELHLARGAWIKWAKQKVNARIASRKKLGIVAIEQQIRMDGMHWRAPQNDTILDQHLQISIDCFDTKRPHPASIAGALRSNKRLCKPDWYSLDNTASILVSEVTLLACYWLSGRT
jgi:hypothetical protein